MTDEHKTIIKYRLEKSDKTFAEAEVLASNDFCETAVNRLYYSCFYAVLSLLYSYNLSSRTHKGANVLLQKHFVSTGKLSKVHGQTYYELLNLRQEADYQDFIEIDKEEYFHLKSKAKVFLEKINELIITE